jgi:sulfatase modifying factor 1
MRRSVFVAQEMPGRVLPNYPLPNTAGHLTMLDKRLKWIFLVVTLIFAGLPLAGIFHEDLEALFDKLVSPQQARENVQEAAEDPPSPTIPGASTQTPAEDMILIPAGEFLRGYSGGGFDEKPEGKVWLDAYWIDRYEVPYSAYMGFVTATRSPKPLTRYVRNFERLSGATQPMVNVSWNEANAYCHYRGARLPTEAEWEKSSRGPQGLLYPWGNADRPGAANTGNPDPFEFTSPGGSFPLDRSPYGVYDTAGNAMEWVADWYQEQAFMDTKPNPKGPDGGQFKVIRGSSWETLGNETRLTIRLKGKVEVLQDLRDIPLGFNFRRESIGFRCAKAASGSDESVSHRSPVGQN